MTPQEKAKELIDRYINLYPSYIVMFQGDVDEATKNIKQGALIAVDEILNENSIREGNNDEIITYEPYWLKVKQEIEKL